MFTDNKSIIKHYEDNITGKMQITAILDETEGDIAGRIIREFDSVQAKHQCRPCRIIFIFEDWDGEIAEYVDLNGAVSETEAIRELISKISAPLEARGIKIDPLDELFPDVLDIIDGITACTRHSYRALEIIY